MHGSGGRTFEQLQGALNEPKALQLKVWSRRKLRKLKPGSMFLSAAKSFIFCEEDGDKYSNINFQ